MKTMISKLPPSVRAEARRQWLDSLPVLLPEDRVDCSTVEPEHQVELDEAWNRCIIANEERHRRARSQQVVTAPVRTPYFLTVEQVATRWNVSERTIWRMIRDGRLPSTMIGSSRRIREEDVEKYERALESVA